MNSAEDELEAAFWAALTRHKVTVIEARALVADLIAAAVAYAAADSDALTAARRMVLHEATAPGPGHTSPSTATGGGRPPVSELDPSGSHGRLAERATLSTGRVIPPQVSDGNPQAVDSRPVDAVDNRGAVRARVDSWDGRTEELLTPLAERSQADAH